MNSMAMPINSTQLLHAYEQARDFAATTPESAEAFATVAHIFEDKKRSPDACIMVYGVYNAGKSTLINVLLGRQEAAMDDIPLTDQVTAYTWGKYTILDTPGVDAPIAHENVTKAQMLKADAVIFVVDPLGTAEEAKTLEALVDLLAESKQVFMVFNDKKGLTDEDYIKLKDQTREHIQLIAAQRGMSDILKDVPITRINAKRALLGQLKGKPELVQLSGYPAFEGQLTEFLDSISPNEVYGRLKHKLLEFLSAQVASGNQQDSSSIRQQLDQFLQHLVRDKSELSADMVREIDRHRQSIYEKTKRALRTTPEDSQQKIERILHQASEDLQIHLNKQLQDLVSVAQQQINDLQTAMPQVSAYTHEGEIPTIDDSSHEAPTLQAAEKSSSGISLEMAAQASKQMASMVRPQHIVSTLQTVKELLPSMMKGIGPKTMEKWAGAVLTKYIPYIGTAITAGMALWNIFSGDPEEKAMQQQLQAQQQARERAEQQMDDFAQEVGDHFKQFMRSNILQEVDAFFEQLNDQVDRLREGFNETERLASERLQTWATIQQQVLSA